MNLDKHQHCSECGAILDLRVGIWITPGDDHINTGNIDWEGAIENAKCSSNWWCPTCDENSFPE